jgi:ATP-dependent DNA ligase
MSAATPPKVSEKIQWVKPELVCEVAFAEWTDPAPATNRGDRFCDA